MTMTLYMIIKIFPFFFEALLKNFNLNYVHRVVTKSE